ncbi:D-2-hydroxyacid dehydrogenase [Marinobacter sp. X15-166B]|uniref:D-2-hydroxyacid dehydrogenase n=1 Tax=Marinobacter sp. X15-166B TaxID=1897620 RepID=UPI00085C5349|nr:D-2-hydroxyacid dehydrogenase [Marinobacter sp. X15-166B]OEY66927.1 hydroxyacid dehydrogenase [Marinobacter sp. X15-166B]
MNHKPDTVVTVLTASAGTEPPGMEALKSRAEVRFASDEPSLRAALPGTDVLLVTDFRTDALAAAWEAADSLQWVHAASAGVDRLMFPALVNGPVTVSNARGIFDHAIAEYVLCTVLMFAKDFPRSIRLQLEQRWQHRTTERVDGKRVLVVGAGSIGRQIARLLAAVGMEVHGIARRAREQDPDFVAVHGNDELHGELGRADYVVIAAPLTPQTRGLFDRAAFTVMRSSARLINIGRGPIVDTDALVQALRAGEIAGAGLDVFEQEPLPAAHPLWGMDNVIMTAHMAGDVVGWEQALIDQFVDNLDGWLAGKAIANQVDKKLGYAG